MLSTGLFVAVPSGYEMQVRSRSGLAAKHGVFVLNSPGCIDPDYRGEIKVILHNTSERPYQVEYGERIAQLVLVPVLRIDWAEVNELNETERGEGGFGHTG